MCSGLNSMESPQLELLGAAQGWARGWAAPASCAMGVVSVLGCGAGGVSSSITECALGIEDALF